MFLVQSLTLTSSPGEKRSLLEWAKSRSIRSRMLLTSPELSIEYQVSGFPTPAVSLASAKIFLR